jgi:hypothetical protein
LHQIVAVEQSLRGNIIPGIPDLVGCVDLIVETPAELVITVGVRAGRCVRPTPAARKRHVASVDETDASCARPARPSIDVTDTNHGLERSAFRSPQTNVPKTPFLGCWRRTVGLVILSGFVKQAIRRDLGVAPG